MEGSQACQGKGPHASEQVGRPHVQYREGRKSPEEGSGESGGCTLTKTASIPESIYLPTSPRHRKRNETNELQKGGP